MTFAWKPDATLYYTFLYFRTVWGGKMPLLQFSDRLAQDRPKIAENALKYIS